MRSGPSTMSGVLRGLESFVVRRGGDSKGPSSSSSSSSSSKRGAAAAAGKRGRRHFSKRGGAPSSARGRGHKRKREASFARGAPHAVPEEPRGLAGLKRTAEQQQALDALDWRVVTPGVACTLIPKSLVLRRTDTVNMGRKGIQCIEDIGKDLGRQCRKLNLRDNALTECTVRPTSTRGIGGDHVHVCVV